MNSSFLIAKRALILSIVYSLLVGVFDTLFLFVLWGDATFIHLSNKGANFTAIINTTDTVSWRLPDYILLSTQRYYTYNEYYKNTTTTYDYGSIKIRIDSYRGNETSRTLPRNTVNPWTNLSEIYRDALNHNRPDRLPELQIGEVHMPPLDHSGRGVNSLLGCPIWLEQLQAPLMLFYAAILSGVCLFACTCPKLKDSSWSQSLQRNIHYVALYLFYIQLVSIVWKGVFSVNEPIHMRNIVKKALKGPDAEPYGIQIHDSSLYSVRSCAGNSLFFACISLFFPLCLTLDLSLNHE